MQRRLSAAVMLSSAILALLFAGTAGATSGETLTVPFVEGPAGVVTTKYYTGLSTIQVSGYGQAAGSAYSDAFYIFTDGAGNPISPNHLDPFGLYINSQPADAYVQVPPYQADHTYTFVIRATGRPLHFSFAIGDSFTPDNSGAFTITITRGSHLKQLAP